MVGAHAAYFGFAASAASNADTHPGRTSASSLMMSTWSYSRANAHSMARRLPPASPRFSPVCRYASAGKFAATRDPLPSGEALSRIDGSVKRGGQYPWRERHEKKLLPLGAGLRHAGELRLVSLKFHASFNTRGHFKAHVDHAGESGLIATYRSGRNSARDSAPCDCASYAQFSRMSGASIRA